MLPTTCIPAIVLALVVSVTTLSAADSPQSQLSDGLFAFYTFEGTAEDQSGNANHATPGGNHGFGATGLQGQALQITGDGSIFYAGGGHLLLPSLPASANAGFSASLWVKDDVRGVDNEDYLALGNESDSSYMNIMLRTERGHPLMFSGSNGSGGGFQIAPALDEVEYFRPGNWKHLALTYGAGRIRAYLNGQPVGEAAAEFEVFPASVAAVGRHWWGGNSSARMSATLDNVRLFQRTLGPGEIEALYRLDSAPSPSFITNGLVAYFPFNEGVGDASGKEAHGTFQGDGRSFISGVKGKAVRMQGDTRITGTGIQVANTSHTISFWYRRDFSVRPNPPLYGGGFGIGTVGANGKSLHIGFDYGPDRLRYSFWNNDFDIVGLPFGELGWEQIVFAFDQTTMQRSIFRNGVKIATQAAAYGYSGSSDFAIVGGDATTAQRPTAFDEFRVYNRALNDFEVGELFRQESRTDNADSIVAQAFAWGLNEHGQASVPKGLSNVVQVAAGVHHSLALTSEGAVIAWGGNTNGQTNVPVGLTGVKAIAAGAYHSVALRHDGTVVAWGLNDHGQATIPPNTMGVVAIAAGGWQTALLKVDGSVAAWGNNWQGSTSVPAGLTGVKAIAAGVWHMLALKQDGTVVAWGDPRYGAASVPGGLSGVTQVAAGYYHSLALKADGSLVAWGRNDEGQTTIPASAAGISAIAAGDSHSLALGSDGKIRAWGRNANGQTAVPSTLRDPVAIAAGGDHTLVLGTALADADRDGLTDEEETFTYSTSPTNPDSDDDGLNDGDEVRIHRTNPLRADSDGDGYTDSTEIFAGKDPRDANNHPAATLGVFAAIELEFFTQTGKQYVIESSNDLSAWNSFEGPITGDGKIWKKTFSARETETRFYRVVLAP